MPLLFDEKTYQPQQLRDYQQNAVKAIREAWDAGEAAPLAALATGAGKTTIIAQLLRESVNPHTQRALVIGHTEEIIGQLYDRIHNQFAGALSERYTDRYAVGMGIVMADNDAADARIVVATRQSLHPRRLAAVLRFGAFDYCLIDEAHHAAPGTTYLDIVAALRKANPNVHIAGFTATPKRTDDHALGALWTSIAYQWLIPDGITGGYLVPVTRVKVKTEIDLSGVKTSHGDYAQTKMVSVLKTKNWEDLALKAYRDHVLASDRSCLAFFPSVEMSQQFTKRLNKEGIPAGHIDGETPKEERRKTLQRYMARELRVISNFGVLTEGFDAPATSAILLARPTRSQTLFTQVVGRGLRPYPGKHDCLLVDLAVQDVKALEVGTLLGRMIKCVECGAEYFAGLKACSNCGFVKPWKSRLVDGDGVAAHLHDEMGKSLLADYESLFEKSFAAWFNGDDGFFTCTLSFEDGALLIIPPLEDNYFRLAHIPKDKKAPVDYLARNEDLASLMMEAEKVMLNRQSLGAPKDAAWREQPASQAQIDVLRGMGVSVPMGLSKGYASQLITHRVSVRRLMQE